MTDFFKDADLVLSDLWAGLLLLVNEEFVLLNERRRPLVSRGSVPRWMNIILASRMMQFALGVYGWPYYVMNNSCSPRTLYRLCKRLRCCRDCRCDQVLVLKDNCCQCNTAALTVQTGIADVDLFHVNFKNKIYEVPFVACADTKTSSIVIAIRGSMSLTDAVTDLCLTDDTLQLYDSQYLIQTSEQNGSADGSNSTLFSQPCPSGVSNSSHPQEVRVHRGILNCARYVHGCLTSQHVIEDMQVLYPDFDLVITGHSLGAGVAAVVAMLLKPKFPRVRCFAFSPPGCVVSENALPATEQFVCSVVMGDDLVPRLSFQSMRHLKRALLNAIENCEQAKYEILLRGCYKLLCGTRTVQRIDPDAEAPPDPVMAPEGMGGSPRPRRSKDSEPLLQGRVPSNSYTVPDEPEDSRVSLHIPGRVLHITGAPADPEDQQCCTPIFNVPVESQIYTSAWSDYSKFEEIKLSSRMINDHWPFRLADILRFMASQEATPETLRL